MARKGNNPDNPGKQHTEQETGTKRRYQSPQTPPQAPRSREQQDRGQDHETMERDRGERGRAQSHDFDQQSDQRGQEQQSRRGSQQDWQDDAETGRSSGRGQTDGYAGRGSDFDLQKASRDELNAIARELNIDDFETMNREELVIEIRERS